MIKSARIKIPAGESDLIALAVSIKAKHTADAAGSAIGGLNWADAGPKTDRAAEVDTQIGQLKPQLEQLIEERSNLATDLANHVRASRDVLQGVHRDTPRKLQDWGFTVSESPAPKKKTPPAAGASS